MRRRLYVLVMALVAVLGFAVMQPGMAEAATGSRLVREAAVASPPPNLTPQQIQEMSQSLTANGYLEAKRVSGDQIVETYEVDAAKLVITKPSLDGTVARPDLRVTVGWGVYVYFNRDDQSIISAGAFAGLALAICGATSETGPEACVLATAILASAAVYIDKHGVCRGELETWLHLDGQITNKCM